MRLTKGFLLVAFLILALAFSVDALAKGGGKGGGGKGHHSGAHGRSHKGGHHMHPIPAFYQSGAGYYYRGFGYGTLGYPYRNQCYYCHPTLKGTNRTGSCKYGALPPNGVEDPRVFEKMPSTTP